MEFSGPSTTAGYYHNPDATRRLFPHGDDWLDSGDRGYLADGDMYLTGRVKDLIIRGGRNIYPYELEQAVGDIEGIRKGCVAVFASADPATGSERLVVVAETRATQPEALASLRQRIQSAGVDLLGRAAGRCGAGAAARGAENLQRQDSPDGDAGTVRAQRSSVAAGGRCGCN